MKVHQFARGLWEQHEPSLTLGCCKTSSLLLRPLAPKLPNNESVTTTATATAFDLKSFIRPDSGPRKLGSSDHKMEATQVIDPPKLCLQTYIYYYMIYILLPCKQGWSQESLAGAALMTKKFKMQILLYVKSKNYSQLI